MKMQGGRLFLGLAAAILAATCLGFPSWSFHKSSDRETNVTFVNMTKFKNGETLAAGTYQMEVPKDSPTPEVTFYKDGKPVATINAKIVTQQAKNADTEIDSVTQGDTQLVTAIRPGGWDEAVIFSSTGKHGDAPATR